MTRLLKLDWWLVACTTVGNSSLSDLTMDRSNSDDERLGSLTGWPEATIGPKLIDDGSCALLPWPLGWLCAGAETGAEIGAGGSAIPCGLVLPAARANDAAAAWLPELLLRLLVYS